MVIRKKKARKKHQVKALIQIHSLSKAGTSIEFEVYSNDEKIGTVIIGRGSLTWRGKGKQIGKTISWSKFAEMIEGK